MFAPSRYGNRAHRSSGQQVDAADSLSSLASLLTDLPEVVTGGGDPGRSAIRHDINKLDWQTRLGAGLEPKRVSSELANAPAREIVVATALVEHSRATRP